jgi:hypothetical protein
MRYWKRLNSDSSTNTVESYSHDFEVEGAVEISKAEFDTFVSSLPLRAMVAPRDLAKEIDDLKARLEKLEKK